MAYVNNVRTTGLNFNAGSIISAVSARFERYATYRRTLRELGELSDRDLSDLGIHRSSIRRIALDAAYDN